MKTRFALVASVLVASTLAPAKAEAPTNLHDLLAAARQRALPVQNQRAAVAVAEANQAAASSALWPRLSASAGYTRNQYDVTVTIPRGTDTPIEATIQPLNQLEGTLQLDVPLLDLATRRKATVAARQTEASKAGIATVARDAERQTIAAFYSWLGGEALRAAGDASLHAAQQTLDVTQQRSSAGLATELDVAKARASVARANRALAQAALISNQAKRQLRTLTGSEIAGPAPTLTSAPTGVAVPQETLLARAANVPELTAARSERSAQDAVVAANQAAYVPTVNAFARERITNAAGFGSSSQWAVGVALTWHFDLSTMANVKVAQANASAAHVREQVALQQAQDRIADAYQQIIDSEAAVAAAVAEAEAAKLTTTVTENRATQGTATLIQVLDARADDLDAQVVLIRARASLAAAQALLALEAGMAVP